MTNGEQEGGIRRILIALDASPHSLAALQSAAELAARLNADLLGLYVEDINLVRLGMLPNARQVAYFSATLRAYGPAQVEEELRSQANQARRALTQAARRAHLRSEFRVTRGVIPVELIQAAQEADLIILGKSGWSRGRRMGSTTRLLVAQSPRQMLVLQHGTRLGLNLAAIYSGSPLSQKALRAAADLLQGVSGCLTIYLVADDIEQARHLQDQASTWLRERQLGAGFRWLIQPSAPNLARTLETEQFGALIIPGDCEKIPPDVLASLIDEVRLPVLVVR
jgi:nucleotide-binding universal stress UspA family protein